jgi:hypothetical protein
VQRGVIFFYKKTVYQRINELEITLPTFNTNKLEMVYVLVHKEGIKPTII